MSDQVQSKLLKRMSTIKHKILVLSGKGGVGKSTVSTQLAFSLALSRKDIRVGILDVDICGPSIPKMLGIDKNEVFTCTEGWVPVKVKLSGDDDDNRLCCMSIGFLLQSEDDAVVWRGPKKHSMIQQFLEDTYWGDLDALIIDTPPGTSDEHITLAEILKESKPDGAIIVTTPQGVSLADVRKEINFCNKLGIPVLGVVENMSGFACPCCNEITNIFSSGGGRKLAEQFNIDFLGQIPIDPQLASCEDEGKNFLQSFPESASAKELENITNKIKKRITLL
ncbi:Nubp2 [Acrasis kona]|uniref:Cytosolic Fe-S cluster assembly factor NUBP2 homolog n=1 Tax=Acrasis kona TaxID=1008807 RepID=A0AAW2Z4U2_9EUKA